MRKTFEFGLRDVNTILGTLEERRGFVRREEEAITSGLHLLTLMGFLAPELFVISIITGAGSILNSFKEDVAEAVYQGIRLVEDCEDYMQDKKYDRFRMVIEYTKHYGNGKEYLIPTKFYVVGRRIYGTNKWQLF